MQRSILGLDIGGANLKAAHTSGESLSQAFALWKYPDQLSSAVAQLLHSLPPADHLALTMTGELCDCWPSKQDGVFAILDAVCAVAQGREVHVWTNQGTFVDVAGARTLPYQVASANWLALASYAGRFAPTGSALLLDIGTTTTDLIPLLNGRPVPQGRTDPERLRTGELVYLGWKRTPLCRLGTTFPRVAEFFATMHDVCLHLKLCPEQPDDRDTADGQPAVREAAARRLARMLLHDLNTVSPAELDRFADSLLDEFTTEIGRAFGQQRQHPNTNDTLILGGSGEFLWPVIQPLSTTQLLSFKGNIVSLKNRHTSAISSAACAYAVAVLLAERGTRS